jgi:hypothetical protein
MPFGGVREEGQGALVVRKLRFPNNSIVLSPFLYYTFLIPGTFY